MARTALRRRMGATLGSALGVVTLATGLMAAPAQAQTGSLDSPQRLDFYVPPADFPATAPRNGDLVRSEPMPLALTIPGLPGPLPAQGQRILYRSTGAAGGPVAVSGTFMKSTAPWTGRGPRPLASLAVGTQGQGDQCAPSKSFQNGLTVQTSPPSLGAGYEIVAAWTLLGAGFDVVATDYEGLGTPGVHTYVDRGSEARAVLDAARAAQRLPGSGVGADTPVVYTGYSQGGGAAAAAAEEAGTYAPDLHSVGANAVAPPADLPETLKRIDGSTIVGAIGYAINGFLYSHPELRPLIDTRLNQRGKEMLAATEHQCIADSALAFGLHHTSEMTTDGRPAWQVIGDIPEARDLLDRQRIGRIKPSIPVRVQGNVNDDAVPYGQVRQLGRDWCALGAAVDFQSDPTPPVLQTSAVNHLVPMLTHTQEVTGYLTDRVNGVPAPVNCGSDPAMR